MNDKVDTALCHDFGQGTNQQIIEDKLEDLTEWCQRVGIDMQATIQDSVLVMGFNSRADMLTVRACKFQSETNHHTQRFVDCTPRHQQNWVDAVEKFLNGAGIDHSIKQDASTAVIKFGSMQGLMVFTEMNRTGFFDRMSEPGAPNGTHLE